MKNTKLRLDSKKISHKGHKEREEHEEDSRVYVRYLIAKTTHSLRTKTTDLPFVIFVS